MITPFESLLAFLTVFNFASAKSDTFKKWFNLDSNARREELKRNLEAIVTVIEEGTFGNASLSKSIKKSARSIISRFEKEIEKVDESGSDTISKISRIFLISAFYSFFVLVLNGFFESIPEDWKRHTYNALFGINVLIILIYLMYFWNLKTVFFNEVCKLHRKFFLSVILVIIVIGLLSIGCNHGYELYSDYNNYVLMNQIHAKWSMLVICTFPIIIEFFLGKARQDLLRKVDSDYKTQFEVFSGLLSPLSEGRDKS